MLNNSVNVVPKQSGVNYLDQQQEFVNTSLFSLLKTLLNKTSVTPDDAGCQTYIAACLGNMGFTCQQFSINGVSNMIASIGQGSTRIAFAGHTDVVPPGDISLWRHSPFELTLDQGYIYGRGIADMKGGIAAMLVHLKQLNPY